MMATPNTPSSDPLTITTPTTRRFPTPCWTNEETVSLIQSYRDKWYSLRRGNLKAHHWQEVADSVSATCHSNYNNDNPPKTCIQCRHKMEKLRKRYRAECLRLGNVPKTHRYLSTSWLHFKQMDYMELGLLEDDNNSNDDDDDDVDIINDNPNANQLFYPISNSNNNRTYNHNTHVGVSNVNGNSSNGVRVRIPSTVSTPIPTPFYNGNVNVNVNGSGNRLVDDYPPPLKVDYGLVGTKRKMGDEDEGRDVNVMGEMVAAIDKMRDGFVKMEQMKMDMAREIQSMRMKMDMQRTEMIIESQQKLVDAFLLERKDKKAKRMPTPES